VADILRFPNRGSVGPSEQAGAWTPERMSFEHLELQPEKTSDELLQETRELLAERGAQLLLGENRDVLAAKLASMDGLIDGKRLAGPPKK
jgi:hypothetical protein